MTQNKKGQVDLGGNGVTFAAAMGILITVIVAIVIYTVVAGIVSEQTTLLPNQENVLEYNSTTDITLANLPVRSISAFVANRTASVTLVEGDNYTLNKVTGVITNGTGNVISDNITFVNLNRYNITYTSEPAGFIEPGTQQTIVVILPILFLVFMVMFMLGVKVRGGEK